MRLLRTEEYYTFYRPNKFLRYFYARQKNIVGARLGFFICAGCFDSGLKIYHYGSVIVNPKSRIGKTVRYMAIAALGVKVCFLMTLL